MIFQCTDRENRCRAFEEFEAGKKAIDDVGRTEGTSGIMDQHCVPAKRVQTRTHRIRALGPAFYERADIDSPERFMGVFLLTGTNDHAHSANSGVSNERLYRPA